MSQKLQHYSHHFSIGTANWGQSYGILKRGISSDPEEISAIINFAREEGVYHIDTAINYGNAEFVLGQISVADFLVTTKLPSIPSDVIDVSTWMTQQVKASLRRLHVPHLNCVLLHKPEQLLTDRGDRICEALCNLKLTGIVQKIGISIYEPEILSELNDLSLLNHVDVVQAPMNAFDRRLVDSGWSSRLSESGIEIEARSVFLQGLLTTPISALPTPLSYFSEALTPWWLYVDACEHNAVSAAIHAVSQLAVASRIIVGVNDLDQLRDVIAAANRPGAEPVPLFEAIPNLIDPRQWPAT